MISQFLIPALFTFVLGAISSFFEVTSKFRANWSLAIKDRWAIGYILSSGLLSDGAFLFLITFGGADINPWKLSLEAGFGLQALLRSQIFSIHAPNGEAYGVGPAGIYKMYQDLCMKEIDDGLVSFRSELLRDLKSVPIATLKAEVIDILVPSSAILSQNRLIIEKEMALLAKDPTRQVQYLAEFLLNNASSHYILKVLKKAGIRAS